MDVRLGLDEAKKPSHDLASMMRLGQAANMYARTMVKKGGTQIENNLLEENRFFLLHNAVNNARSDFNIEAQNKRLSFLAKIHSLHDKKLLTMMDQDKINLTLDHYALLTYFESSVKGSIKYSLGNCDELAFLALYYITENTTDVRAEKFFISGGQHTFLVINRKYGSDPNDPSTWGDAIICDPWSLENQVYKATEYKEKLKNFWFNPGTNQNMSEPFDHNKHQLTPEPFHTDNLHQIKQDILSILKIDLQEKALPIINTLTLYINLLENESDRLNQLYSNREKSSILQKKIKQIDSMINAIPDQIKNMDYDTIINEEACINKLMDDAILAMKFNSSELATLNKPNPNKEYSVIQFFSEQPDHKLKEITEAVNQSIQKTWPTKSNKLKKPNHIFELIDILYNHLPEKDCLAYALKHITHMDVIHPNNLELIVDILPKKDQVNFIFQSKNKITNPKIWSDFIDRQMVIQINKKNHEVILALLKAGFDPNTILSNGLTPLGTAIVSGHSETVGLLLKNGASLNQPVADDGTLPQQILNQQPRSVIQKTSEIFKQHSPTSDKSPSRSPKRFV